MEKHQDDAIVSLIPEQPATTAPVGLSSPAQSVCFVIGIFFLTRRLQIALKNDPTLCMTNSNCFEQLPCVGVAYLKTHAIECYAEDQQLWRSDQPFLNTGRERGKTNCTSKQQTFESFS